MVRGSCRCGAVAFEADELTHIAYCHCSLCRKASGSLYGTWAYARPEAFRFTAGADRVTLPHPGANKGWCAACGTRLPALPAGVRLVVIPAGCLDSEPGVRPAFHQFVGSKVAWDEIADTLPKFAEWVPGYEPERR